MPVPSKHGVERLESHEYVHWKHIATLARRTPLNDFDRHRHERFLFLVLALLPAYNI